MRDTSYFHASDDPSDIFRRTVRGPFEQAVPCVDGHFEWLAVPKGYFAKWGIEPVAMPEIRREADLYLIA